MKKWLQYAFVLMMFNASGQAFKILNYESNIILHKEGFIDVDERISVNFTEPRHGIYRTIPYVFKSGDKKYQTRINEIRVEGEEVKISEKRGIKTIRIGNGDKTLTGEKVYNIHYRVTGPFILSEEYSEFYWNITGNEWENGINQVSFSISLPDSISIRYNDLRVFTGSEGADEKNATIAQRGNVIYGNTTAPLQTGQGLTVAIRLPSDYIDRTSTVDLRSAPDPEAPQPLNKGFFYVPLILLGGLLTFWKKLRGDSDDRQAMSESYPPGDLSPAEVGAYYDDIVHDRDVVSLLPYWASLGHLKMVKNKDSLSFEKISDLNTDRPAYERQLFDNLFEGRDYFDLSDLKEKFYTYHYQAKSNIKKELKAMELYDENYSYWFKSWRGILIGIGLILVGFLALVLSYLVAGILFLVTGVVGLILCGLFPPPSQKGRDIRLHLKGLYQFLKSSPPEEIAEILKNDEKYFEKLFPFAVAFGLDKKFAAQFAGLGRNAPEYYYGNGSAMYMPVTMNDFSDSFNPKAIGSAFSSMPASSSDGGGFSGGSSGGGFGGGGGGSW